MPASTFIFIKHNFTSLSIENKSSIIVHLNSVFPINNLYTIVVWLQYLTGRYSWVCHLLPAENKLHTVHVSLTQGFSY